VGQEEIKNSTSAGQDQQVADKTNWRKAKRYKSGYKRRPRTALKWNKCHQGGPERIRKKNDIRARQFTGFVTVAKQQVQMAREMCSSALQATRQDVAVTQSDREATRRASTAATCISNSRMENIIPDAHPRQPSPEALLTARPSNQSEGARRHKLSPRIAGIMPLSGESDWTTPRVKGSRWQQPHLQENWAQ
jgi:hypothetical protein